MTFICGSTHEFVLTRLTAAVLHLKWAFECESTEAKNKLCVGSSANKLTHPASCVKCRLTSLQTLQKNIFSTNERSLELLAIS